MKKRDDSMKKLWKAVKREFDLWKKRRAYFKQLEKEFEKKQTG
jgi:plasmid maintenance system antidote protein VapI|tara:strand:- start:321 stop:449 length:129 start_codon:yes stop_codon:yes gene_type:complete